MTDKPSDAEIIMLAVESGVSVRTGRGAVKLARAVLAKWGQPAQAAEPFCWHWENTFNSGMGAVKKNPETLGINMSHPGYKWTALYTAPQPTQTQPVAREPLTDEQIKALMQAHRTAMLMTCKARVPECGEFAAIAQDLDWLCESFGIKGGQRVE